MSRPRQPLGPNPPGRLPAAMLRALAAEMSDPGRFSRAKAYARDGAVVDIDVQPGLVQATIQGSRYEPYVASVAVGRTDDTETLLGLIPDRDDVVASCTCPDDATYDGALCKHALATLLVLADEITVEPGVLARWRSGPGELLIGGSARDGDDGTGEPTGPVVDVLADLLKAPAPIPPIDALPRRVVVPMASRQHDDVVAGVLGHALVAMRSR